MAKDIYRLVYYSRNQIAGDAESFAAHVDQILAKSRQNNQAADITGALMFNAGCFAQVLEGPLAEVETTFERIQQDERHGEVSLLAMEPIEERSFPNWAMGFVGASDEHLERFAEVGHSSGFDLSRLDGEAIHTVLRDLTMEEEFA